MSVERKITAVYPCLLSLLVALLGSSPLWLVPVLANDSSTFGQYQTQIEELSTTYTSKIRAARAELMKAKTIEDARKAFQKREALINERNSKMENLIVSFQQRIINESKQNSNQSKEAQNAVVQKKWDDFLAWTESFLPEPGTDPDLKPGPFNQRRSTPLKPGFIPTINLGKSEDQIFGPIESSGPGYAELVEFKKPNPTVESKIKKFLGDPKSINQGMITFLRYCAVCHQADASGRRGPNLTDSYWIYGNQPAQIYKIILEGNQKRMMPKSKGILTETQIFQIVAYIKSLRPILPPRGKGPQGSKLP